MFTHNNLTFILCNVLKLDEIIFTVCLLWLFCLIRRTFPNCAGRSRKPRNLLKACAMVMRYLMRKLMNTRYYFFKHSFFIITPAWVQFVNKRLLFSQARLTCPCCNSRVKDAVLTKCFHVFCFECVKTRYDTRQRKCPKCNAAFGANDFHRIYIG